MYPREMSLTDLRANVAKLLTEPAIFPIPRVIDIFLRILPLSYEAFTKG